MQLRQYIPLLNNPSPIVIIGAGGIVTDAHLPAYSKAGWKVLGIYDRDLEKAKAAKVRFPFVSQTFSILDDLVQVGFKENAVFDLAVPADQILSVLDGSLPRRYRSNLLTEGERVVVEGIGSAYGTIFATFC